MPKQKKYLSQKAIKLYKINYIIIIISILLRIGDVILTYIALEGGAVETNRLGFTMSSVIFYFSVIPFFIIWNILSKKILYGLVGLFIIASIFMGLGTYAIMNNIKVAFL